MGNYFSSSSSGTAADVAPSKISLPDELYCIILNYLDVYELYTTNCIVYFHHLIPHFHSLYQLLHFFHAKAIESIDYFPSVEFILSFFKSGNHENYQRVDISSRLLCIKQVKEAHLQSFTTLLYFTNFNFITVPSESKLQCIRNFFKEHTKRMNSTSSELTQLIKENKLVHQKTVNFLSDTVSKLDTETVITLCKVSPKFSAFITETEAAKRAVQNNIQCVLYLNAETIFSDCQYFFSQLIQKEGLVFFNYVQELLFRKMGALCQIEFFVQMLKQHPSFFTLVSLDAELLELCLQQFSDAELKRYVPNWEKYFIHTEFTIILPKNTYMNKLYHNCKSKKTFLETNPNYHTN